jgi:hypothetical protein
MEGIVGSARRSRSSRRACSSLRITAFAAVSDSWLWIKNQRLARRQSSPLMEAQWRFFRSKSVCD